MIFYSIAKKRCENELVSPRKDRLLYSREDHLKSGVSSDTPYTNTICLQSSPCQSLAYYSLILWCEDAVVVVGRRESHALRMTRQDVYTASEAIERFSVRASAESVSLLAETLILTNGISRNVGGRPGNRCQKSVYFAENSCFENILNSFD